MPSGLPCGCRIGALCALQQEKDRPATAIEEEGNPKMKPRSIAARWPLLRSPWIRYGAITLGLALWTYGLIAQLDSSAQVLTYLAVSLVIAAIALA
jgi:hypothetical protein